MKKRPRPQRNHYLDEGMRNWIIAYAKANLWRVPNWYQWEDLIQEGFLCYCKCCLKYKNISKKHFMALVQRTFVNRVTDLSRKKTVRKDESVEDPTSAVFLSRGEPQDTTLMVLLNQMPAEIKSMLLRFVSGKAPRRKRYRDRRRETNNEYLCKTAGLDPKFVNIKEIFNQHMR